MLQLLKQYLAYL